MKLLLVEDTPALAEVMALGLRSAGFAVDCAGSAEEADQFLSVATPDVIVLDLGLPDRDGTDLLRDWRSRAILIPVLVMTARGGLNDKVEGLDRGADDYVVKPVAPAEVAARCRALLRRQVASHGGLLTAGNVMFDAASRLLTVGERRVSLPRRETNLLEILLRQYGNVVTRRQIEASIYELSDAPGPNALEASVSRLRKALRDSGATLELHTVRGVGYMLDGRDPDH